MEFGSETEFVDYNGLNMRYVGENILTSGDDGDIIDWLSQYDYPREMFKQSSTYTLVFYREEVLDLVLVNNFTKEGDKGLTVAVWLDFVKYENDLRYLGRPYDEEHEEEYLAIWKRIGEQIKKIGEQVKLPEIGFALSDGQQFKPHFRYA